MHNKSFTLIETLIIIVIIGILSGFTLTILNSVIDSANDAKRKKDLDSISKIITTYKVLNNSCPIGSGDVEIILSDLIPNYTTSFPKDPRGNSYTYFSDDGNNYTIKAILSNNDIYQYESATNSWNTISEVQPNPIFNPSSGTVEYNTTVIIASPGADAIYYTTDGTTPTTSSTNQATTPLIINSVFVTVKALAIKNDYENSEIITTTFSASPFYYKENGYWYCKFNSSDIFTVPSETTTIDVIIVGGGGGTTNPTINNDGTGGGGGGGGGVIINNNYQVTPGTDINVTVGAGGIATTQDQGGNGGNSIFGDLTAIGGGGGARQSRVGGDGGSGGGGSANQRGGYGTSDQGKNGGIGGWIAGGGGGGANEVGGAGSDNYGGAGGNGIEWPSGSGDYYGGGGGGGGSNGGGAGGTGGGGAGAKSGIGTAGSTNTGGGAGGSRGNVSGTTGGSGIVIVRWLE